MRDDDSNVSDRVIAEMVIKDIKIMFDGVPAHRHRGFLVFPRERERTVGLSLTFTDPTSMTKVTTNTKVDDRGHVTYEEHIMFDVHRPGPWKISFKCTDPEGVGAAAIIGEGVIDLPDYNEIQHKFEPLLKNGDTKIGKLSFGAFLLTPGPPPATLSRAIYGGDRCGQHIGYFLIENVECTLSDRFRAHLEWTITKPQVHSTLNYYKASDGKSKFPIIFELWAVPEITLEVVARQDKKIARMEVLLTSQAIWPKLFEGQKFEVKESLMENRARRCTISFTVSCHGLLKFKDLVGSAPIPVEPQPEPTPRPEVPLSASPLEIGRSRSTSTRSSHSLSVSLTGLLPERTSPPSHSIDSTYPPQPSRTPGSPPFRRRGSVLDNPPSNIIVRDRYLLKYHLDVPAAHPLYIGEHLRTKDTFIVKVFPLQRAWVNETDLLVKLKGKQVVKLIDADTDQKYDLYDQKYDLYFTVMVNYGENLEKELDRLRLLREDAQSQRELFKNICEAVRFVHSKNIVHLNLEPSHILLKENGSLKIRLCGFSRAREVNSSIYRIDELSNGQGTITPGFRSPELVSNSDIRATFAMDIFSLGSILYYIVSRTRLYDSEEILPRTPIAELVGHSCRDTLVEELLLKMLARNPNERPSIEQVLQDAYFVGRPPSPYE
ncbi:8159_t:CDS:2 [Paraglomus occultum]|uniref:8159_t:CDS:1 n=1 Tax=Paraglomus occultum TaxID=144539 RepID=A0A9N9CDT3_9GLOM|nr:8159_t:CDS:2 [Paraglomus occultum]